MDKNKIALGIDAWFPQVDGVSNVVVNYRNHLEETCDCIIVAPSYGKKTDAEGERSYCADVFHNRSLVVPFLRFRNSAPRLDRKLKKMLNSFRPSVLHAHSPFAICAYFAKYGKKHGIPVVYTFHTKYKDEFMRFTHSRLLTAILMRVIMRNIAKADYVWAVSRNSADTLRAYGYKGEIAVMRNGTDMSISSAAEVESMSAEVNAAYGLSASDRVFVYIGRVVSVKNLKFSLQTLAELKRRGASYKFLIVGGGEELEAHKKYAEKLGLADDVIFTGFVGDREMLRKFYARGDLFLLPSVFDNAPLVMLEAASCRTPSLVPIGSSAAEIITDGTTGYAEELDVQRWADKIQTIFADADYPGVCDRCTSVVYTWDAAVRDASLEYQRIIEAYAAKRAATRVGKKKNRKEK